MARNAAWAETMRPSASVTTKPSGALSTSFRSFQVILGMTPTGIPDASRDSRMR